MAGKKAAEKSIEEASEMPGAQLAEQAAQTVKSLGQGLENLRAGAESPEPAAAGDSEPVGGEELNKAQPAVPLEQQIDRKFSVTAVSRTSYNVYDESNAVVFLARDPALLYALDGYLTGCIALGADVNQIEAVKLLKQRVEKFQSENPVKLPGVETDEEMQRLS